MSENFKRGLLICGTALAAILLVKTCQPNICDEYCSIDSKPGIFLLNHKGPDKSGNLESRPHHQPFVQTPRGKVFRLNKTEALDPNCFSETDYLAETLKGLGPNDPITGKPISLDEVLPTRDSAVGNAVNDRYLPGFPGDYYINSSANFQADGNLRAMELTWDNTTITFINFDKSGRLESRVLTEKSATKSGAVHEDINLIMQSSSGTPVNEYKALQYFLTNLMHTNGTFGRPAPAAIDAEGFDPRNLTGIDETKTPFYRKFTLGTSNPDSTTIDTSKGHVFFYVILDENLKFQRDTAATIPFVPEAENAIVNYYSPFVQYPIIPKDYVSESDKADVMTVHFYQGGTMDPSKAENNRCSYPFDIGVIAMGQDVDSPEPLLKTPLFIDPEVETEGILP